MQAQAYRFSQFRHTYVRIPQVSCTSNVFVQLSTSAIACFLCFHRCRCDRLVVPPLALPCSVKIVRSLASPCLLPCSAIACLAVTRSCTAPSLMTQPLAWLTLKGDRSFRASNSSLALTHPSSNCTENYTVKLTDKCTAVNPLLR